MNTRDLINRLELSGVEEEVLLDAKEAPEVRIRIPTSQGNHIMELALKDLEYKDGKIYLTTSPEPPTYPQNGPVPERCSSYVEEKHVNYQ